MDVGTKFFPVISKLNPVLPARTPVGLSPVICGIGLAAAVIVNVSAGLLVPPPGEGVNTVTIAAPGFCTKVAGTWPVICVSLRKIVISESAPNPGFHCTTDWGVKFFPVTVNVN